ncbi:MULTISPECIES: hypothetical protein [unclassified Prochlorococcus]|uniref:hypothetical protein n=1 Tax=unclassified Prochlorococcus TaxID=2627481 RepID=UPI000533B7B8|nr:MULTISPECIES: hypothetical protein [unclassified Prochlorococcus]KGG16189.1 hypothetical protein EV07_1356 [Prochlorococcus sp. MIT 0603]KGG18076.1 hypothetical protein EV06_0204 [Prochlorococcus sp. MIT 0602]
MDLSEIKTISPLYNYWLSEQTDEDERERLLIANTDSKAVYLFKEEPYKWESLFQSISREIINGDNDSIRGMKVLLDTISISKRNEIIELFSCNGFFNEATIKQLSSISISEFQRKSKTNRLRFLRILLVIFTNPYGITIKRKKNHLYEFTGSFINNLRQRRFGFH